MKSYYYKIILRLFCFVVLISVCNCRDKDISNSNKDFFQDESLHYALYIAPAHDCQACYFTALEMLEKINLQQGKDALNIIALKSESEDTRYLMANIKEQFKNVNIILISKPLPVLHPSVLVVKKRHIFLHLFLPANPYDMKDLLDKMEAITANYSF